MAAVIPDRWELGSDFHRIELTGPADWPWAGKPHVFAASGREALRQLVELLRPRVARLPDYYCDDVGEVLRADGVLVETYADDPCGPLEVEPKELTLGVNTWGLRAGAPDGLVEDHTHDPTSQWAHRSHATYAFASLRKALPLADGAVLWSPQGLPLPRELPPSPEHEALAAERWRAMDLKAAWLTGAAGEKDAFRALYVDTEQRFAADLRSGMSTESRRVLGTFAADAWQQARQENFRTLAGALGPIAAQRLLRPAPGARAFAATFQFQEPAQRDAVKAKLIAERIYPAVLWPTQHPLAQRVLSVHCDGRYSGDDVRRAAAIIDRAVGGT